jgi:hypothetical protein
MPREHRPEARRGGEFERPVQQQGLVDRLVRRDVDGVVGERSVDAVLKRPVAGRDRVGPHAEGGQLRLRGEGGDQQERHDDRCEFRHGARVPESTHGSDSDTEQTNAPGITYRGRLGFLERETGFEPATLSLGS